jgi:hypothetical protein
MNQLMIEIRNFRAHEALGAPYPHDAAVPIPAAGDVVEIDERAYVCRHRSFEYRDASVARIYVMVEPDEE